MERARAVWRRWWRSPARDAAFAVAMAVITFYGSYGEAHPRSPSDIIQFHGQPVPHPPAAAYLLVVAASLVLAVRRRWPFAVLAAATAGVTAYSLAGYINGAALLAPVAALYAVASQASIRKALACGAGVLAVLMAATAAHNPFGPFGGGFVLIPALVAAATFAGIAVANRRAYIASIEARAQQDARRRIDEERLRIARELHDVVAHTMATINVQAGAAAHVLAARPDDAGRHAQVAQALQSIRLASKEGLRELRAVLNVLRQADEADPTEPAPGIGQLTTLVAGVRRAGLETTVAVTGQARPLPAAVDLTAYRIIQESLTNTIRHAGPATAAVALGYREAELRIEVTDTGRGQPPGGTGHGSGHGLAGMAERAAAVGGTVEAGPDPAGGFRVAARLPLNGQPLAATRPAREAAR
jgi:signal transduction histidine kinase